MYQLIYLYDIRYLREEIEDLVEPCPDAKAKEDLVYRWICAIIEREFYLNVVHRYPAMSFDLCSLPIDLVNENTLRILHRQIQRPPHLAEEWVQLFLKRDDLTLLYDFSPRDYSTLGTPCITSFPPNNWPTS